MALKRLPKSCFVIEQNFDLDTFDSNSIQTRHLHTVAAARLAILDIDKNYGGSNMATTTLANNIMDNNIRLVDISREMGSDLITS